MTTVPYVADNSIANILNQIEHLYQDVMDRIDRGEEPTPAEVKKLALLAKLPVDLRNREIIRHPDTCTSVYAEKWGVSRARVSQIRTEIGGMRKHKPGLTRKKRKAAPVVHPHAIFR